MELVEETKKLLIETAKELKGRTRRLFIARTVCALGEGGQRLAERELGWNRKTIRKGQQELSLPKKATAMRNCLPRRQLEAS